MFITLSKADSAKATEYISSLGIETNIAEEKVAVEEEILESVIDDAKEDCEKGDEVVEYAMIRTLSPMMVAKYKLQLPDKAVLQKKLQELVSV